MSILARLAELARADVDFREAERLLNEQRRQHPATGGKRVPDVHAEALAELREEAHHARRESRLTRWLGWDICPPPEGDETNQGRDT